jgi:Lrp/AsnC family leucine-responsive transcriptional regulator
MDATDRLILTQLQADGRVPNATLAERVHLSPSPCLRRLKRLEGDGTIRGYRAILDRRRIGLGLTVFVEVKVTSHSRGRADEFAGAVAGIDAVVGCYIVAGQADFLLEVAVPDLAAYERLLLEEILELPGVTDVRSNIVIRTIKESGPLPLDLARAR